MSLDVLTAGVGFFSFGVFLLVHFITFRWIKPERLLKSLFFCVMVTMIFPILLIGILGVFKVVNVTGPAWVFAAMLASLIQGLLCFFYVLCIFGPYETSVRMRLVREIQKGGPIGVSPQELSERYNPKVIVDVRLQRLMGSGDLVEEGGFYRIGCTGNFFFIFDAIAAVIKRWIGR